MCACARRWRWPLDKQDIVDKIIRSGEPVARTLVPPGNPGYIPPAGLPHDLGEAQRLLAEAGYPGGRNFPDVTLLYGTKGSSPAIATRDAGALGRAISASTRSTCAGRNSRST